MPAAVLELTYRCNQACPFCYAPWLENPALIGEELTVAAWKEKIERLLARGVSRFTLSGGEPLLKDGVGELLRFLAEHPARPRFTLYTNGALLDAGVCQTLAAAGARAALSLPGMKNFRKLTGGQRTIYDMIDTMALLKKHGVGFSAGVTVTRPTLKQVEDLASLAALNGAESVQIGSVMLEGRCLQHPELWLTYPEILELGARVKKLRAQLSIPVTFAGEAYCSCRKRQHRPEGLPPDYAPPACTVDRKLIVVGADGRERRCLHTDEPL